MPTIKLLEEECIKCVLQGQTKRWKEKTGKRAGMTTMASNTLLWMW
ncbi:17461_t:CDS:2 [Rhizophagus irregularis]|nr:17461_t:CDS:2 [Rhizophagus irregularis]